MGLQRYGYTASASSNIKLYRFKKNIYFWIRIYLTCSDLSLETPPTLCESLSSAIRSPLGDPNSTIQYNN